MTNKTLAILSKYPTANPNEDFLIRSNSEGQYIAEWNLDIPMPTNEELEQWYFDFIWEAKREEMSKACNEAILEDFSLLLLVILMSFPNTIKPILLNKCY